VDDSEPQLSPHPVKDCLISGLARAAPFQKPSTERYKISVSVLVSFATENRGFGTDFDNRNKTKQKQNR